jgi:hypothetical protein
LSLRASILRDLGRQEEEVAVLQQLVATEQRNENYRIRLGHAFRTLGRADEAVATYRSVLTSAPYEGTSWWSLANLKTVKFGDADIATMEKGLTQPQAHVLNRVRLHFALGKAFEDRKEIERSFHHYDAGNRLRNTSTTYRPERISGWVDQAAECYSEEFLSGSARNACQSAEPIFVIGIQRSGSTLLEQILDSHPDIEGTAELTELPTIIREQGDIAHRRGISFNELLRKMSADELRGLGEDYLKRTSVYRLTDKPRFTDKMPNNWLYTGVIRKILPNAKIIDMRRHPLDCCFSNWKQLYGRGLEHSYSILRRLCPAAPARRQPPAGQDPSRHLRAAGREYRRRSPRPARLSRPAVRRGCAELPFERALRPDDQRGAGSPADQPQGPQSI